MIELSKELLKTEYIINKLSSYKIAEKYNCTAAWVNTLRKKYKIKTLKPYERNAAQTLSQMQREYIYGSLLGDGCVKYDRQKSNKNAYLSIAQSRRHKNYVKFQYFVMKDFVNMKIKVVIDKRPNRQNMFRFRTISHPIFTYLYKQIYPNNIKRISSRWLQKLTPFSLAIWYMDDGSVAQSNHMMRISTESFSYKELLLIRKFLKEKWGILPKIYPSNRENKFILKFKAEERNKFFLLIEPHIIPEMQYKIYKEYKEAKWKKWTPREIKYLKENYFGRRTNWNKMQILNHSKGAIMRKASYLRH